jgi:hypothetical protein
MISAQREHDFGSAPTFRREFFLNAIDLLTAFAALLQGNLDCGDQILSVVPSDLLP